jgi:hypothetical protein
MKISFIKPENHRLYFGLIMALAFFAQSLLPAGYMPQFNTGKFFEITICHGDDIAKVVVDEHMNPVKDGGADKLGDHYKSCPYASASFKGLALLTFLYHYTEQLTYERAVERKPVAFVLHSFWQPYEGRAPPQSLA